MQLVVTRRVQLQVHLTQTACLEITPRHPHQFFVKFSEELTAKPPILIALFGFASNPYNPQCRMVGWMVGWSDGWMVGRPPLVIPELLKILT